jgi:hypothetical protein
VEESTNAEVFRKHHHRRVDEAETQVGVPTVNLHGARELIDRRRRLRERPGGEIARGRITTVAGDARHM